MIFNKKKINNNIIIFIFEIELSNILFEDCYSVKFV